MLLRPGSYQLLAVLGRWLENSNVWQSAAFDLSPYRGQDVVLYFEVYNDSTGEAGRAWMFVDDVSVLACANAHLPAAVERAPTLYLPLLSQPAP